MIHACKEAKKRGITNITLDDLDYEYINHNIYTDVGMVYENKDEGPGMIGDINKISDSATLSL